MLLLLGALLALPEMPSVQAQFAWEIHTIQRGVQGTGAISLVLDSDGNPHVAFVDLAQSQVVYARWTGEEWSAEIAAQGGVPFGMVSMVLDNRNRPHISYFDAGEGTINYAHFDGFAWRVLTVGESHPEGHSSIALGPEATPYVAYARGSGRLRLAHLSGAAWSLETVDPDVVTARFPSLAFSTQGRPRVAYYGHGVLFYAEWIGFRWLIEIVDEERSPRFVSLVVDAADVPKIGYRNSVLKELRFAWKDGSTWNREVVDKDGDVGWDSSLALDAEGNPHLSYYDRDRSLLKYAFRPQDAWFISVVDQVGVVGWWSSMAIGADGQPHFAYYSWTDQAIRYAFGTFALGLRTWEARDVTPTSALLVGEITSLGDASTVEVFFEYWFPGGNWSLQHVSSVNAVGFVTAPLSDLQPETLYEYRVVGSAGGIEVRGDVLPFTTPPAPPPEPVLSLPTLLAIAAGLIGAILVAYALVQRRKRVRETPRVERPKGL